VCVGESPVSSADYILNGGTEPILRFHLGFVLKRGLVLPVSIMRMGSIFFLGFQVRILMQTNLGQFIIAMIPTFFIF